MINLTVNGRSVSYDGDSNRTLLTFLRGELGVTSPKDGCSGQGACGACLVEIDGKAKLACVTPMKRLEGASVLTIEGFPEQLKRTLGEAFARTGAVQCGFCTPGFLTRTKLLLETNPAPTREEATKAVRPHLCRCTGYVKIVDAVLEAAAILRGDAPETVDAGPPVMGSSVKRCNAYERAVGEHVFTDDMTLPDMLHGALKYSEHPRALVKRIDASRAMAHPGVERVFTAADVPCDRHVGMIQADWPVYVAEDETTRTVADVLACVVADSVETAHEAAGLIDVEYDTLDPLTDMTKAEKSDVHVHEGGNLLAVKTVKRGGDADAALKGSAFMVSDSFATGVIEHGFIEPECAVAEPMGSGVHFYTQGQGIFHERDDVARMLGLEKDQVRATLVDSGGAFGGKEDLTVQPHAALAAFLLQRPVKVKLTRPQSLRMHPKRHPMRMEYALGCDREGNLTAIKARILGDTGAYASIGGVVMTRAATHAAGAYHVPIVDVESRAVFTNNIPNGAMRGFGVNQVTFAMEALVERLCTAGGFDPLEFRYKNALDVGRMVTTGQVLGEGVGLRQCLDALRGPWERVRGSGRAGLACAVKNCGAGNGLVESCVVKVDVHEDGSMSLHHGWSEMGQGIHTVGAQYLAHELGIDDLSRIRVDADTVHDAPAGATTASRGTLQFGMAVLDAAAALKKAMGDGPLEALAEQRFEGRYVSDRTNVDGPPGEIFNHVAYGFAAHLVLLDEDGAPAEIVAAHDAGTVVNRQMLEGQIEGGVVMGLGAALSEKLELKDGRLASEKLRDIGLLRAPAVPKISVTAVENHDPEGPLGAKGVGEIGAIPTAPALAAALCRYDGLVRRTLPLPPPGKPVSKIAGALEAKGDSPWSCY